jgi:hypothetical protein
MPRLASTTIFIQRKIQPRARFALAERADQRDDAAVGGRENWRGSGFHADVVTVRVLAGLVARRNAEQARLPPPALPDYWIEQAADAGAGPDWDVVERQGTGRILEELKSGKISADERRAIWIRVRRTSATIAAADVTVRLTVDRDRVELRAAWEGLASLAAPKTAPSRPPKKVKTAQDLQSEALTFLTHPDPRFDRSAKKKSKATKQIDLGPALSFADAAALLGRFAFDDGRSRDDIQAQMKASLRELRSRATAEVLQKWLLGHFFEAAQTSGAISARSLSAGLPLVDAILHLEPDIDRLIDRVLEGAPAPVRPGKLQHRPWRDAQPHVATAIDAFGATTSGGLLALTGEAGLGKSVVLAGVFDDLKAHGDQVAWLSLGYDAGTPPSPQQLERLVDVLARRTAWSGVPTWLLVDGIDGVPDAIHSLRPREKLRVVVAARSETYEPRRQFSAQEVALQRWDSPYVTNEISNKVPPDLIALLGNPFLLDLALKIDPGHLRRPTRFAILSRFLADVVFSRGAVGIETRACFDVMARGLVRGDAWTTPPASGVERLVNCGVAAAPGGGRVRFAHPLFGEIGVATWAAQQDAQQCSARLLRVRDSFVRGSALRMLLEGCVDVGDSACLLDLPEVGSLLSAGLKGEFDVVGGLAALDVVVPEILKHPQAATFCARLFEAAKLADNRNWLEAVAMLEVDRAPEWATVANRDDALPQISEHVLACGETLAVDIRKAVAIRLRAWSANQPSHWTSYLVDIIAAELPDNDSLAWMDAVMAPDRPWVAGWLRQGLRRICARGAALDVARVKVLADRLVDPAVENDGFQNAYNLLLGERTEPGLIATQPEIAIELIFSWQDHDTRRDREQRQRRRAEYESDDEAAQADTLDNPSTPLGPEVADVG